MCSVIGDTKHLILSIAAASATEKHVPVPNDTTAEVSTSGELKRHKSEKEA